MKEKAKRLVNKVTEETVLTELVVDTIEDIKDTQLTINSVLAEEAKKKPVTPPTPPTPPVTPPTNEPNAEMKEFMESWKAEQNKTNHSQKATNLEAAKTKFSDTQQSILKTVVENSILILNKPMTYSYNLLLLKLLTLLKTLSETLHLKILMEKTKILMKHWLNFIKSLPKTFLRQTTKTLKSINQEIIN